MMASRNLAGFLLLFSMAMSPVSSRADACQRSSDCRFSEVTYRLAVAAATRPLDSQELAALAGDPLAEFVYLETALLISLNGTGAQRAPLTPTSGWCVTTAMHELLTMTPWTATDDYWAQFWNRYRMGGYVAYLVVTRGQPQLTLDTKADGAGLRLLLGLRPIGAYFELIKAEPSDLAGKVDYLMRRRLGGTTPASIRLVELGEEAVNLALASITGPPPTEPAERDAQLTRVGILTGALGATGDQRLANLTYAGLEELRHPDMMVYDEAYRQKHSSGTWDLSMTKAYLAYSSDVCRL